MTLNLSIIIGVVVNMVMLLLFNSFGGYGVMISVVLTVILVKNKAARKHVFLRLKQKFDSFTVGSTNTVTPMVPIQT